MTTKAKRPPRTRARFTAPLFEGHKGVTAVIVPFDPEQLWNRKPIKIDPRRDGWLVRGTMNAAPFAGWIGFRWSRFFIIVDAALRAAAGVTVGDAIEVAVEPTDGADALAVATAQAPLTTAPSRKRATARPTRTARRRR